MAIEYFHDTLVFLHRITTSVGDFLINVIILLNSQLKCAFNKLLTYAEKYVYVFFISFHKKNNV